MKITTKQVGTTYHGETLNMYGIADTPAKVALMMAKGYTDTGVTCIAVRGADGFHAIAVRELSPPLSALPAWRRRLADRRKLMAQRDRSPVTARRSHEADALVDWEIEQERMAFGYM